MFRFLGPEAPSTVTTPVPEFSAPLTNAQKNAVAEVKSQLALDKDDIKRRSSPIAQQRDILVKQITKDINELGEYKDYNTPEKRAAAIKKATKDLDESIYKSVAYGALEEGKPAQFALEDQNKKKITSKITDGIFGWIGGILGIVWDVLQMIPVVGEFLTKGTDWISDKIQNVTPGQKNAAGIAASLGKPLISIADKSYNFTSDGQKAVYAVYAGKDLSKPAEKPVAAPPAAPHASLGNIPIPPVAQNIRPALMKTENVQVPTGIPLIISDSVQIT